MTIEHNKINEIVMINFDKMSMVKAYFSIFLFL